MLWSVRRRFVRCAARCGRLVGRRKRGVRIGSGSGRGSLVVSRARTRLPGRWCRRRLGLDGSARLGGCHRSLWVRCRAVICRLPNGKRSPYLMRRVLGCARSGVALVVARRRFRGSCAATRRLVVVVWFIGPRLRSGTQSGVPAARRSRSSPRTTPFATMWRIVWVVRSPAQMASWCQDPRCAGSVAVTGPERIDGGQRRGVPSRSRTGSGSISPTMSPCESLTKPSTRRPMCKAGVRSNASLWRVCEPGERCESPGPGPGSGAASSLLPRS